MTSGEAPKIVQIETTHVETDAVNFRDVVQSLTGKNSSTAWTGRTNYNSEGSSSVAAAAGSQKNGGTKVTAKPQEEGAATYVSSSSTKEGLIIPNSLPMMNGTSFKDFDRLLLELPPGQLEGMMPWF